MSVKSATVEIEWECDRCREPKTVRAEPTDTGYNQIRCHTPSVLPDGWGYPEGTEADNPTVFCGQCTTDREAMLCRHTTEYETYMAGDAVDVEPSVSDLAFRCGFDGCASAPSFGVIREPVPTTRDLSRCMVYACGFHVGSLAKNDRVWKKAVKDNHPNREWGPGQIDPLPARSGNSGE